jgi:hypothetical protein
MIDIRGIAADADGAGDSIAGLSALWRNRLAGRAVRGPRRGQVSIKRRRPDADAIGNVGDGHIRVGVQRSGNIERDF